VRGEGFRQLVGALHRPELRHHQVRLHVVNPPGTDAAELVHADVAIAHARLAGVPADRIVNCWPIDLLEAWLRHRRR